MSDDHYMLYSRGDVISCTQYGGGYQTQQNATFISLSQSNNMMRKNEYQTASEPGLLCNYSVSVQLLCLYSCCYSYCPDQQNRLNYLKSNTIRKNVHVLHHYTNVSSTFSSILRIQMNVLMIKWHNLQCMFQSKL